MKHFINLKDIPAKDLRKIIIDAKKRKSLRKKLSTLEVDKGAPLKGKLLIQMFEKSSLRTRLSFYLAIKQLGGGTLTLRSNELHLGQGGESIADTAKILSTYGDGFMLRTDSDKKVENFAKYLSIPVINGLTNRSHPCQVMADIMTFEEARGGIADKRVVWVGDSNNVCLSYIHAATQFGFSLTITSPKEFSPNRDDITLARKQGGKIDILLNPFEAVCDADLIVTDTYFSMHSEKRYKEEKLHLLRDYQVNGRLIANAKKDVIFLHCLPAHRGVEVSRDVIDGKNSMVFEAAENRLHVQKAILAWCVEKQ